MNPQEELHDLERRRCDAIATRDVRALTDILADGYIHIHSTGRVDDRNGHIESIQVRPRVVTRGQLDMRVYANTAVLVGEQMNERADGSTNSVVQQVAMRMDDGKWRFISMQVTRKK